MSFSGRLILALHIAFVVFTIGPVTVATMSTPRYIRSRNIVVLRYLLRMTRIFGAATLGVLLFGIIIGQMRHELGKTWLTVSMTLFVVAIVLLVLIMRDQRRAVSALDSASAGQVGAAGKDDGGQRAAGHEPHAGPAEDEAEVSAPAPAHSDGAAVASVERGRIAMMGGVVSLIWLVILVLMVWNG